MKLKTFVILFVICAALAGAAYFVTQDKTSQKAGENLGNRLIKELPMNQVAEIAIKSDEGEVTLKKGAKVWEVASRFGYPADFTKIIDLVKKIGEGKVGRKFSATKETVSRLSLNPPDKGDIPKEEKGTLVKFTDKAGKTLSEVIIGKAREAESGSGGHYVKKTGDETVFLVDKNFRYLDKKSSDWLEKEILKVKAEDVEKIVCKNLTSGEIVYSLKRPEKGKDPEFKDMPQGKKLIKQKLNSILGALSSLSLENVEDPAKNDEFEKNYSLTYHLFDGTLYNVYPGKALAGDEESFTLRLGAGFEPPPAKEAETPKEDESAKKDAPPAKEEKPDDSNKTEADIKAEAEALDKKIGAWTYVITKWRNGNLITDPETFFEKEEENKDES